MQSIVSTRSKKLVQSSTEIENRPYVCTSIHIICILGI